MIINTTGRFGIWALRRLGFASWTSFWGAIYVLPGREADERLLRHERQHLEQIERDGRILFSVKYLWWLARYGYWNNTYEVEARAAELI